ncbi:MAG: YceD family protein [Solirubrobacterales bacterium]
MYAEGGIVDLERLALSSGQARALDLEVGLDPIVLGGQTYAPAGGGSEARLDVSRTSSGYALRLRFATELTGPCVRCLEPAGNEISVDAREVDQPVSNDEELRSPYVAEGNLDVERWANDALVLAFPSQPLCRPDCAGLCSVCGESLNDANPDAHRHSQGGDPRMSKLRDLRLE